MSVRTPDLAGGMAAGEAACTPASTPARPTAIVGHTDRDPAWSHS
jgi:hypothetical protein